jgi:histidyl-tRNA synthetase
MADAFTGKSKSRKPQVLSGFRDYMPQQMILRQRIIGTFRSIFEKHGFEPLDTPALEHLEVLLGKAGENEKLMYQFRDHGDREVGLRYDLTVPLARVVAQHQNELVLPFKRYHIAPVWRAEKPQRGRFREFWQCDADIVGSSSMIADAEAVSIAAEALTAVGLPNFVIQISHRRLLEGIAVTAGVAPELAGSVYRSVDKLAKIGPTGVLQEMMDSGIDDAAGRAVLDAVTQRGDPGDLIEALRPRMARFEPGVEALNELEQLFDLLPGLGVHRNAYSLDLSLARGLDYYTGPVYEATGMSIGLERIIEVVEEFSLLPTPPTVAQVIVPVFTDTLAESAALANELRDAGLRVDLSLLQNKSLGDQLKYAGRRGIPFAAIAGSKEIDNQVVAIKDLASGEQSELPRAAVAEVLAARLNG